MKYLNKELSDILTAQQKEIIMSNEDLIMVEACPGAGKTFTIVQRICKELNDNEEDTGVIACSFTNESSDELRKRLERLMDVSNCFVGTLDSFILSEINGKFINRYLNSKNLLKHRIIIENVVFPKNSNYVNSLTCGKEGKEKVDRYFHEWYEKLLSGTYEISFPSYMLASYIVDSAYFDEIYTVKYSTIYIDEAQDLNFYQHKFIEALHRNTNIKVVMVGDSNQSIYHFRGANPLMFKNLVKNGYKKYIINVSVRCHPSISYYANKIVDFDNSMINQDDKYEKRIEYIDDINVDFLKSIGNNLFILCESGKCCEKIYNQVKNDFKIYYVKPIDINSDSYVDYRDLLEKIIKFYYNFDNPVAKNIYSIDDFRGFLLGINTKIKEEDILVLESDTVGEYIKRIISLLGIYIEEDVVKEIENCLKDDVHKYYYYTSEMDNRIMTIHASKGLENDCVIICLEQRFAFDEEYRNKLFVAITRAVDKVYLYQTSDFKFSGELHQIIPGLFDKRDDITQ